MTPEEFSAELDRLAAANGYSRKRLDDAVFKGRAAYFKQRKLVATDDQILAALRLALAGDAARRELFGLK